MPRESKPPILRAVLVTAIASLALAGSLVLLGDALLPAADLPEPVAASTQQEPEPLRPQTPVAPFADARELGYQQREIAQAFLGEHRGDPRLRAELARVERQIADSNAAAENLRVNLRPGFSATRTITRDMRRDLDRLATLAPPDDEDVRRWRAKVDAVDRLVAFLEPQPRDDVPSAAVQQAVADLAALVGPQDPVAADWLAHLSRARQAGTELAPLGRVEDALPMATDVEQRLARVAALMAGRDWVPLRRWQDKLATVRALRTQLESGEHDLFASYTLDDEQAALLDRLVALVGTQGVPAARLVARAAQLRGPGKPTWAADYGVDPAGAWADLVLSLAARDPRSAGIAPIGEGDDPTARAVRIRLRYLPPGRFGMGSPASELGRDGDEGEHPVELTRGFWIALTELTQLQWFPVLPLPDDLRERGAAYPVHDISWEQAQGYCDELNLQIPGLWARLPTEAEWEYAARAGVAYDPYAGLAGGVPTYAHASIDDLAWWEGTSDDRVHIVGFREPNQLGLRDVHGNLWEWCADVYGPYADRAAIDPIGAPAQGRRDQRVIRGGGFASGRSELRLANRDRLRQDRSRADVGFRLVIDTRPRPDSHALEERLKLPPITTEAPGHVIGREQTLPAAAEPARAPHPRHAQKPVPEPEAEAVPARGDRAATKGGRRSLLPGARTQPTAGAAAVPAPAGPTTPATPEVPDQAPALPATEPETEPEAAAEPQASPASEPEVLAEPGTETESGALVGTGIDPEPTAGPGEVEPDAPIEGEVPAGPETSEPEIEAPTGIEIEAESGTEAETTKPDIGPEASAGIETDAETTDEPDLSTEPEIAPEATTGGETDLDAGTASEPNLPSEPEIAPVATIGIETDLDAGTTDEPDLPSEPEIAPEATTGGETDLDAGTTDEPEIAPESGTGSEPEATAEPQPEVIPAIDAEPTEQAGTLPPAVDPTPPEAVTEIEAIGELAEAVAAVEAAVDLAEIDELAESAVIADELVDETVADELVDEPIADELADETVADELVDEPIADELADETVADELADETVADELADETVADETVAGQTPVDDAAADEQPGDDAPATDTTDDGLGL